MKENEDIFDDSSQVACRLTLLWHLHVYNKDILYWGNTQ